MPILVTESYGGGVAPILHPFEDGQVFLSIPHEHGNFTAIRPAGSFADLFVPGMGSVVIEYIEYPCIDCKIAEATDDWTERCGPCREKFEENREPVELRDI